jgi:hypothetical protein
MLIVGKGHEIWVAENGYGFLKWNAVSAKIITSLYLVPFETEVHRLLSTPLGIQV